MKIACNYAELRRFQSNFSKALMFRSPAPDFINHDANSYQRALRSFHLAKGPGWR